MQLKILQKRVLRFRKENLGLFLLGALLINLSGFCQSKLDSIDIRLQACLDTNFSSYDMLMCKEQALDEWDEKLNALYTHLVTESDSSIRACLISSQESWRVYFDDEIKLWESYNDPKNSVSEAWLFGRYNKMITMIRNRVAELNDLLFYFD